MRRMMLNWLALIAACAAIDANLALAAGQMMSGGQGQPGGRPTSSVGQPDEEVSTSSDVKPDVAAKKAYNSAMKALNKAKEYEAMAAAAPNADKKGAALEKMNDNYNKALDLFTEALSNKGDMVEAWDNVGYVHLRLGAYAEAVDDYNHVLALKPDLLEAIAHRAEANLALDRLGDVEVAYMDLFAHAPALATQLMLAMQKWLVEHRDDARGMRPADVAAFDKWLQERDTVAQQSAAAAR
ncbi:MAG: tetratricopeptide repeat protein [Steroidobacteraceae bacterium]